MKVLGWICRLVLSAVFFAACVPKILDPRGFAVAVFRYQMLPSSLINLMAIYLPWVELVAAVALLMPRTRDAASFLVLGMLLVFTTAIVINLFRGLDIACGCFTTDPHAARIGWQKVAENTGLIVLAVAAWVEGIRRQGVRTTTRCS